MYVHMRFQIAWCWEGFRAERTLVWFLLFFSFFWKQKEKLDTKLIDANRAHILCVLITLPINPIFIFMVLSVAFDLHIYGFGNDYAFIGPIAINLQINL